MHKVFYLITSQTIVKETNTYLHHIKRQIQEGGGVAGGNIENNQKTTKLKNNPVTLLSSYEIYEYNAFFKNIS